MKGENMIHCYLCERTIPSQDFKLRCEKGDPVVVCEDCYEEARAEESSIEPMCHCGQPLSAHRIGGGAEHDFVELMNKIAAGFLEVGTNGSGEVVINHPDLKPDENGVGHIVFSVAQAEHLAPLVQDKAREASRELRAKQILEEIRRLKREIEVVTIQMNRAAGDSAHIASGKGAALAADLPGAFAQLAATWSRVLGREQDALAALQKDAVIVSLATASQALLDAMESTYNAYFEGEREALRKALADALAGTKGEAHE